MIFYSMDLNPDLPKDTDCVRGWLSRYSDAELIAQYSFCKHIDDFNFRFDEPDTEHPFVFPVFNYSILVCEEMAKRYFRKQVFEEVL